MNTFVKVIIVLVFIALVGAGVLGFLYRFSERSDEIKVKKTGPSQNYNDQGPVPTPSNSPTPTPDDVVIKVPTQKLLSNNYHIFQTFNNCGPASLSMALSYYGLNVSQKTIGDSLRPYQNPAGDNDDKSVTLYELAEKSKEYDLIPYYRPNGTVEMIEKFITIDIPVITRTWLKADDDIGHYRVVKGYNQNTDTLIQDDSLQGKNLEYSYNDFNDVWDKFNYEFLVLIPKEKELEAKKILGNLIDEKTAWEQTVNTAHEYLSKNPNDINMRFNLSVAYYNSDNIVESIKQFEKIENELPQRTLWYQIEPILAYYKSGDYKSVIRLSDRVLNDENMAFSELHYLKSLTYSKIGEDALSRESNSKVEIYNRNFDRDSFVKIYKISK
ncbi:MAG: Peptidase protein [Patescibacteria group bacterium]|nr:Peptidase protein [Patescibacteria group bacterium]